MMKAQGTAGDFPISDTIPNTGGYEWRVAENKLRWSNGVAKICGVTFGPGDEAGFLDFVHPDDRMQVEARISCYLGAGSNYSHSFRIVRRDGQVRTILDRGQIERAADGTVTAFRGVVIDTTDDVMPAAPPPKAEPDAINRHLSRLVGRASGLGAYELDVETGAATWSKELLRILGRPDALCSGSMEMALQMVHPDDRQRVRGDMASALDRTGPYDLEYRLLLGKGDVRWVRDRGDVIGGGPDSADGPARAVGVLIDITRRKIAEESLASTDALLEALFENSPVGIGVWDRSFRYLRVNRKLAEINGLPVEAHIGRTPEELLPGLEGIQALYAGWRRILRTGKPWLDVQLTGKTPADPDALKVWRVHFFPVETGGEIVGIAATAEDVTAEHHAEMALRNNALQLQRILDGTVGFVGILDIDGTVTEANAPALTAAGLVRSDVIGRHFWDTHWWSYDADVRARLKSDVQQAAAGQQIRHDAKVLLKDDQKITIDFQLSPVTDDTGRVTHIIPSGFDVTDRNEALDHLQMLMAEVNHRSKNVLSLVQAIARQTVKTSPDDFLEKFSSRIGALAQAQDLLVQANWASVDLRTLVTSQLGYFKDSIGQRIQLSGPDVMLSAQAAQSLSMVLHELATNAGKYGSLSNAEGRVDIDWTAENIEGMPLLSLTWAEHGGPPVTPPQRTGFGSLLINTMIESAFDAKSEMTYDPAGVAWRLTRGATGVRHT